MEAADGMKTFNESGQQYGLHPVVVGQWKKEILQRAVSLFEDRRGPKPVVLADEDRLYEEIGRLKMGLDWLKKGTDYKDRFANRLDRPSRRRVSGHSPV